MTDLDATLAAAVRAQQPGNTTDRVWLAYAVPALVAELRELRTKLRQQEASE